VLHGVPEEGEVFLGLLGVVVSHGSRVVYLVARMCDKWEEKKGCYFFFQCKKILSHVSQSQSQSQMGGVRRCSV